MSMEMLLVFVAVYTGMSNTHSITFSFPLLLKSKISQPAALLFFGMFAIGVVVGLFLMPQERRDESGDAPAKKRK